jgi:hypothetical protein
MHKFDIFYRGLSQTSFYWHLDLFKRVLPIAASLSVASLTFVAKADVLFFDLNNSPQEIKAAQRGLRPNERLIVIPSAAMQAQSLKLRKQANEARRRVDEAITRRLPSPEIDRLFSEEGVIRKKLSSFRLSNASVKKELKDVMEAGAKPSRIVISGHDGNGRFNGEFGNLDQQGLSAALRGNPGACDNVTSLFLLGCYTTTPGEIKNTWKQVCPSINLFGGYDGSAPANSQIAGHTILEDMLKKDGALQNAKTAESLKTIFNSIKNIRQTTAAICVGDNIATNKGVVNIPKLEELCRNRSDGELKQKYDCYANALPGCENPPGDTQAGVLRQYYQELQRSSHCDDEVNNGLADRQDVPSREKVLSLMFFKNVKNQFASAYRSELKEFDEIIRSFNAPEELSLKDMGSLSRAELLNRIHSLRNWAEERMKFPSFGLDREDGKLLGARNFIESTNRTLLALDESCVPFDWVENRSPKSPCIKGSVSASDPFKLAEARIENLQSQARNSDAAKDLAQQLSEARTEFRKVSEFYSLASEQLRLSPAAAPDDSPAAADNFTNAKQAYKDMNSRHDALYSVKIDDGVAEDLRNRRATDPTFQFSLAEDAYLQNVRTREPRIFGNGENQTTYMQRRERELAAQIESAQANQRDYANQELRNLTDHMDREGVARVTNIPISAGRESAENAEDNGPWGARPSNRNGRNVDIVPGPQGAGTPARDAATRNRDGSQVRNLNRPNVIAPPPPVRRRPTNLQEQFDDMSTEERPPRRPAQPNRNRQNQQRQNRDQLIQ